MSKEVQRAFLNPASPAHAQKMSLSSARGWLQLSWMCWLVLFLFTGCESVPDNGQNTRQAPSTNSVTEIKTSVFTFVFGPPPVLMNESSGEYQQRFGNTLQWNWQSEVYKMKLNPDTTGQIRVQFHLNSDASISDFKLLANSAGAEAEQVCRRAILEIKSLEPWPKEMCQRQFAGYFTIRALFRFQHVTDNHDNQGDLNALMGATLGMGTYRANLITNTLVNFRSDPTDLIRGLAQMRTNRFLEALTNFNNAIDWDPGDAWAWSARGFCLFRLKNYDGAMTNLARAVTLDPQNASAWNAFGLVHIHFNNYTNAVADCSRAIALDPDFAAAYRSRAYAKKRLQDFSGALSDASRCFELSPTNADASFTLGQIRYCLQDYENALTDCNRAIELNPKYGSAYALRGGIQLAQSDSSSALESYRKALALDATLDYSRFQIWALRSKAGEMAEASAELKAHFNSRSPNESEEWSYKVEAFLAGSLNEDDFMTAANGTGGASQERSGHLCEANYYAGMKHLLAGDKAGAANLFQKSTATNIKDFLEYNCAQAELKSLLGQVPR